MVNVRGVYKRGNVYWLDYFDEEGRRHRDTTRQYNKKTAEEILSKIKSDVAENRFLDKKKTIQVKFKEFTDDYLKKHSINLKSYKTADCYNVNVLNKAFGGKFLHTITSETVSEFIAKRNREVSPATVNRHMACLHSIFNKAKEWGRFGGTNPVMKHHITKESAGRTIYLKSDEIPKFIECCEDTLKPLVVVSINTGLRRGEMLSLEWADVDLKNKTISLFNTKSGESRIILVNEEVKNALNSLPRGDDSPYVFSDKNGKPCVNVRGAFKRAVKKAKLKNFRWHDLRHTYASLLAMKNVSIYTIAELLGHSTIRMTKRYAHLSPKYKQEVASLLDGVCGNVKY